MGHQDKHLELRAMAMHAEHAEANLPDAPIVPMPTSELESSPLALDHDAVPSWRETARFFRKAA